jgi:hypothetical protein
MFINLSSLPQEIIDKLGLLELAHDGRVYIEIQKGMYGLPHVNTSGKAGAQIPQLPLGDDSSPWGR